MSVCGYIFQAKQARFRAKLRDCLKGLKLQHFGKLNSTYYGKLRQPHYIRGAKRGWAGVPASASLGDLSKPTPPACFLW